MILIYYPRSAPQSQHPTLESIRKVNTMAAVLVTQVANRTGGVIEKKVDHQVN